MSVSGKDILEKEPIEASAPCRIDMGGTLDISSFYYPMAYLSPCTVNMAVNLRTVVRLGPHRPGFVRVSSRGFESVEYALDQAPFSHPMGLIFAIAAHYRMDGIHIRIDSASPPQSALGGSSVAAVAMIGAYQKLLARLENEAMATDQIPLLAHAIEQSIAGVPCGLQDQLAAVYGGVHVWHWKGPGMDSVYQRKPLIKAEQHSLLDKSILLAYCGIPHVSKDINSRWVQGFLAGDSRGQWREILECTKEFAKAIGNLDCETAAHWMNRETDIRCGLTPDVLDDTGSRLVSTARETDCGARFCGAGGGGCLWAIGHPENIQVLRGKWADILDAVPDGRLLDASIDADGLT
jgi:D-glycero-alpha-D-manno-heptose-7-phosphate kinase